MLTVQRNPSCKHVALIAFQSSAILLRWLSNSLQSLALTWPVSSASRRWGGKKQSSWRTGSMEERFMKAKTTLWLKDEKADEMRCWERLEREKEGKTVCVCVCVSHPDLDVGLLFLEASIGLLSFSQSAGRHFSVTNRATKLEQFQNIRLWQQ